MPEDKDKYIWLWPGGKHGDDGYLQPGWYFADLGVWTTGPYASKVKAKEAMKHSPMQ